MRSGSVWLLGLAGAALTNALALDKRDSPAVLAVPVVRGKAPSPSRLLKRSETVDVEFDSQDSDDTNFKYNDSGVNITGVASDSLTTNTLSLGYGNTSSTSLTQALADSGAINSPAFMNGSGLTKALRINIDEILINETAQDATSFPLDVVFDTEVGMTYVPKSVAQALNAKIGATRVPDEIGQVNFSCSSVIETNTMIEFKFGDLVYQFWIENFISGNRHSAGSYGYSDDLCYFTICENLHLQDEGSIILGSNSMSLIYAVFDLENDEVSLALRNGNVTADDIVEIKSGKDGVPGAKKSEAEFAMQ
ncbi:hypothetical protein N7532_000344 [Penicillium argentinense]|uniref:Peptidase A1 domain-containing protein n=1 Tax=Penicillium argentinense TaxID=1131581 RepID=A0A9W9G510_9EURO|nr:uncharacterized protein N7532_000344 [Penicillium argentinense]KAJ5112299.1 hypothetical protein N7532_000344 [Penicillium argentinense]